MSCSPDLCLIQRTLTSYTASDIPDLDDWLSSQGYRPLPARSPAEYIRLERGASLIVLYQNGTAALQGADIASARALLAPLVPARATLQAHVSFSDGTSERLF